MIAFSLKRRPRAVGELVEVIRACAAVSVEDDGLRFDPAAVTGEAIRLDADYDGIRIRCRANLGNARIPMQVDVGFGDVVTPAARDIVYPTLLDACDRARCADTCRSQRRSV